MLGNKNQLSCQDLLSADLKGSLSDVAIIPIIIFIGMIIAIIYTWSLKDPC